jgi:hypothetical protein
MLQLESRLYGLRRPHISTTFEFKQYLANCFKGQTGSYASQQTDADFGDRALQYRRGFVEGEGGHCSSEATSGSIKEDSNEPGFIIPPHALDPVY